MEQSIRIDKYLWAVRLFKTRSLAAEACKNNRILIKGMTIKASRTIKEGEEFHLKNPPVLYHYRIKAVLKNRVGAKLVGDYLEDITPDTEKLKLEMQKLSGVGKRERGTGRPTKKDRREMDDFREN